MTQAVLALDRTVAASIAGWSGHPLLDALMGVLTLISSFSVLWLLLGVVAAAGGGARAREGFVRLLWSLVLTGVVASALVKPWVGRERPMLAAPSSAVGALAVSLARGPSFPSGHAAQAAAGAYALALMWPRRRVALYALAGLVAASRVYFGVHYPLDVVAGLAVGVAVARLATGGTPCYISTSVHCVARVPR